MMLKTTIHHFFSEFSHIHNRAIVRAVDILQIKYPRIRLDDGGVESLFWVDVSMDNGHDRDDMDVDTLLVTFENKNETHPDEFNKTRPMDYIPPLKDVGEFSVYLTEEELTMETLEWKATIDYKITLFDETQEKKRKLQERRDVEQPIDINKREYSIYKNLEKKYKDI